MITWLPFPPKVDEFELADFRNSAKVLSDKDLQQQRKDALMLLELVLGWHRCKLLDYTPGVMMWAGYPAALQKYGLDICDEWISRGKSDWVRPKIAGIIDFDSYWRTTKTSFYIVNPPWFGRPDLHECHRRWLIEKNPGYYSKLLTARRIPWVRVGCLQQRQ